MQECSLGAAQSLSVTNSRASCTNSRASFYASGAGAGRRLLDELVYALSPPRARVRDEAGVDRGYGGVTGKRFEGGMGALDDSEWARSEFSKCEGLSSHWGQGQGWDLVSKDFIEFEQTGEMVTDFSCSQALGLASPVLKRSRSPSPPTAEVLGEGKGEEGRKAAKGRGKEDNTEEEEEVMEEAEMEREMGGEEEKEGEAEPGEGDSPPASAGCEHVTHSAGARGGDGDGDVERVVHDDDTAYHTGGQGRVDQACAPEDADGEVERDGDKNAGEIDKADEGPRSGVLAGEGAGAARPVLIKKPLAQPPRSLRRADSLQDVGPVRSLKRSNSLQNMAPCVRSLERMASISPSPSMFGAEGNNEARVDKEGRGRLVRKSAEGRTGARSKGVLQRRLKSHSPGMCCAIVGLCRTLFYI